MSKRLVIGVVGALFLSVVLMGCATTPCPKDDMVIGVYTPFGQIPARVPKGYFDDPDNYMTQKQFEEKMKRDLSE
ncbi:MAG: hypothetical protein ACE5K8_04625 [Candidatus Zixiibacteriota bacterium]